MPPDQLDMNTKLSQQAHCISPDRPAGHCILTSIDVDMRNFIWADVMHLSDKLDGQVRILRGNRVLHGC